MWKAAFCWHTEDKDLYSINYLHFGAPKSWYGVPPDDYYQMLNFMKHHFPSEFSKCSEFMRHKQALVSPYHLRQNSIRFCKTTQREGQFVITFPRCFHAGFNWGFNCAEAVNFATPRWIDYGKWRRVFKNDRIINEGEHAKLETENAEHVRFVDSAGEIVRDACASTRHVEQNGVENFGSVLCSVCRTEGILLTDLAVLVVLLFFKFRLLFLMTMTVKSKRKRTRNTLIAPDSLASGCWEDTLHPKETGHMENGYPCDTVARDGAAQQLGGESLYTANHKPARRGRRLLSAQKRPELFSNIHKSRVGIVCCYVCRVAVHLGDCYFLASVDCNRWKCDRCSTRAYHAVCLLSYSIELLAVTR
ncbi:hypothetical protein Zmor_024835 [Zophobas morio]|uniref:JmjC domain-containing protein n=1 Tax=Zophobas morio TaxID=2755281 RepID=A0AA38HJP8_9CUCU|nr:hypothetical protein Zmor_024835 [Zophobas morio]